MTGKGKAERSHYGWIIVAIGTLVVFGSLGLARFGYTAVLPSMQSDLGMDNTRTGGLATANLVGYLAMSVIGGALAAHYGPRVIIAGGLALAGLGMLLTGLADGIRLRRARFRRGLSPPFPRVFASPRLPFYVGFGTKVVRQRLR